MSRKIGSILVKDGCIISTGYNGPSKSVKHCNERNLDFYKDLEKTTTGQFSINFALNNETICPRRIFGYISGKGIHLCSAVHSERNCILQAARNGISTLDTTIYCYCPMPCKDCVAELINAGVKTIVCLKGEDYDKYARILAKEANIIVREIDKELLN